MGKRLITQRRGRGGSQYRSPSHRHVEKIQHPKVDEVSATVLDLIHAPGRTSPLAEIALPNGKDYVLAAEGMKVGQQITIGENGQIKPGNILMLGNAPEGTLVHNVELKPGDGGKMIRTAGTYGTVVSRGDKVVVLMPSGAMKPFEPRCRAAVGIVAGDGRVDKPFGTAGRKFHALRSKATANKKVSGVCMNPVDHPHGGGSHRHVGKPSTVSRNASPGRKVCRLSPKKKSRK